MVITKAGEYVAIESRSVHLSKDNAMMRNGGISLTLHTICSCVSRLLIEAAEEVLICSAVENQELEASEHPCQVVRLRSQMRLSGLSIVPYRDLFDKTNSWFRWICWRQCVSTLFVCFCFVAQRHVFVLWKKSEIKEKLPKKRRGERRFAMERAKKVNMFVQWRFKQRDKEETLLGPLESRHSAITYSAPFYVQQPFPMILRSPMILRAYDLSYWVYSRAHN